MGSRGYGYKHCRFGLNHATRSRGSVVSLKQLPQEFLKRSEKVLQRMGAVSARNDKAVSPKKAATATDLSATGAGKRASIDPKVGIGKGDNASVANFFQNLLTRGQTTSNLEKRTSTASTASGNKPPAAAPAQGAKEAETAPAPAAPAAAPQASEPKAEAAAAPKAASSVPAEAAPES